MHPGGKLTLISYPALDISHEHLVEMCGKEPTSKCKSPFLLEVLPFLEIKTVLFSYELSSLMSLRKVMTLCFIQLFILVTCSCSGFLHPRHRHYIYCWILINVVWSYLSSLFLEIFFKFLLMGIKILLSSWCWTIPLINCWVWFVTVFLSLIFIFFNLNYIYHRIPSDSTFWMPDTVLMLYIDNSI